MSFSNQIKKELSTVKINNKLEALIELSSILKSNASISIRNAFININFSTESEYVVKRIYKLIDYIYGYEAVISRFENNSIMKKGLFNISVENEEIVNKILSDAGFDFYGNYTTKIDIIFSRIKSLEEKGVSSYLRGLFIGSGSMVNPSKNYHLELILTTEDDVKLARKVLEHVNIHALYKERKEKYILYIKDSEMISNFLNIIKANKALLSLENIKVEKEIRNDINRRINFDMANINKTVNTAQQQLKYIEILETKNQIPENLKELVKLRKKYPAYSLKQLAEKFDPPISKSTVSYKMNSIKKLVNKINSSDNKKNKKNLTR